MTGVEAPTGAGAPPGSVRVALLDPFSGIAGDMLLGALVAVGLSPAWLHGLPATLGLDGVEVRVQEVLRAGIVCHKVEFDIPPQPHGRSVGDIRALVERAGSVPPAVRERAHRVFALIAEQEAEIHGTTPDRVHLHEVGAVDAILDVVGGVWGLALLGVERVHCGPLQLGDGYVRAAHGVLPVPAPATMRILEGLRVRPGPDGAGELVTPTGAALVRVLSDGAVPDEYVPRRSGYGAGTKEFDDRPNALRLILADVPSAPGAPGAVANAPPRETLVLVSADIDDASPEYLADAAEALRGAGALDVVMVPLYMKKGRPGVRLEVLAAPGRAAALERALLDLTPTLGVRTAPLSRRALPRAEAVVAVAGHAVRVKWARTPSGGARVKPEHADVRRVADLTGRGAQDVFDEAVAAARAAGPPVQL